MKMFFCATAMGLLSLTVGPSPVAAQVQVVEGYTFVRSVAGTSVCLGRWIPPKDAGLPGTCEGQLIDPAHLAAISTRLGADRLEQILVFLAAIDQKMAVNNEQVRQLTEAAARNQAAIDEQVRYLSQLLSQAITERFDALPGEILDNAQFKEELAKLRKNILEEVDKLYSRRPAPPKQ